MSYAVIKQNYKINLLRLSGYQTKLLNKSVAFVPKFFFGCFSERSFFFKAKQVRILKCTEQMVSFFF